MHSFKAAGREWAVALTVSTFARVRDKADFDMGGRDFQRVLGALDDQVLFGRVLWAVVEPQANGLTADQFLDALDGDALEAAYTAFVEAYIDFFPKGQRQALTDLLALSERIRSETLRQTQEEMGQVDAATEASRLVEAARSAVSGSSSTTMPASSASTPDLTPSAS